MLIVHQTDRLVFASDLLNMELNPLYEGPCTHWGEQDSAYPTSPLEI